MDQLVYLKITTSNPYEIKVHWEYCYYASRSMLGKIFIPEEWPVSEKYYVVGCRHCRPFEDKRKSLEKLCKS